MNGARRARRDNNRSRRENRTALAQTTPPAPSHEALRSPLSPCEPQAGLRGLSARQLLRGRRTIGGLTAIQLELWLVRNGFAERTDDGRLIPSALGIEIGSLFHPNGYVVDA